MIVRPRTDRDDGADEGSALRSTAVSPSDQQAGEEPGGRNRDAAHDDESVVCIVAAWSIE